MKVFANDISGKVLIAKEHIQLYIKKSTNPILETAEDLKRKFFKEDIQMAFRHVKRCLALLIIRAVEIKAKVRYHLKPVTLAIIKKVTDKCW